MIGPVSQEMLNVNAAMLVDNGVEAFSHDNEQVADIVITDDKQQNEEAVKTVISEESRVLLDNVQGEHLPATQLENNIPDYSKLLNKSDKRKGPRKKGEDNDAELSESEEKEVQELKARDSEVRTHEQQHAAAAGPYLRGGPYYEYQVGPDGQMYAIGGHVDLDVSEEDTPEATIRKAQTIRQAATAPGGPSAADQGVARTAAAMEQEAKAEQLEEDAKSDKENNGGNPDGSDEKGGLGAINNKLQNAYEPYDGYPQTGFLLDVTG